MLKERIQEIFEFTQSEAPYRKANKGWINQDIFLDLSPNPDLLQQKNEAAKVTFFWPPITSLLSNIFLIIILSSLLVFTSISFVEGRFNFSLLNTSLVNNIVKTEDNKVLETSHLKVLDSIKTENEQSLDKNELDKTNRTNSLDYNRINSDQKTITNKIDKQDSIIQDAESNQDIKNLENKKSKSNFI